MWPSQKSRGPEAQGGEYLWTGKLHRLMSGRIIPTILGKGRGFSAIGPQPTFWPLMVGSGTVMLPVGMSFS